MKVNHFLLALLFSIENFITFSFLTKSNCFGLDHAKILNRISDVTYELLSQNETALQYMFMKTTYRFLTKEPLLYPHLRNSMRFSDSTQINIPKPINYANSDSSLFNSDESQSDEHSLRKPIVPPTTSNYNSKTPSSNDSSPIKLHDNSPFKKIIKTKQTDIPIDRLRHPSQNQSMLPPPAIDRTS